MKKNEAFRLFFTKEWKQLLGKKSFNLFVLAAISLIAILSIGFAAAGLSYLQRKMSDPFVTCVDIDVDQIWGNGYESLRDFVEDTNNQYSLGFSRPEQVFLFREEFYCPDSTIEWLDGRSFSMNSPLKQTTIFAENNVVVCRIDSITDGDFGLILSEEALRNKLGFKDSIPSFIGMYVKLDSVDCNVTIPLLAVVRDLPNMCDFLSTECFAQQHISENAEHFNVNIQTAYLHNENLIVCYPNDFESIILPIVEGFAIKDNAPYSGTWSNDYYKMVVRGDAWGEFRAQQYDSLFCEIRKAIPQAVRLYDFVYNSQRESDRNPNIYSCYFRQEGLQEAVEAFRIQLDNETNYKLDMNKVNNLKNLAHIQTIGKTLSYCITVIAISFIVVFLYFLLNMHFQKIQRNIGTFKAFGVDNATLYCIYVLIVFCIISVVLLIAGVIAGVVGRGVNMLLPIEGSEARIDIFVVQNALLVLLVYVCSLLSTFGVVHSKLRHTPGDLIYNRNQN